jgi:hypothetical protein
MVTLVNYLTILQKSRYQLRKSYFLSGRDAGITPGTLLQTF